MATIDKLNYLNETKEQIKDALNDLGAEISDSDTFRSYVTKINDLYDEYPTEEQVTAFQTMQLNKLQTLEQPKTLDIDLQPLEPQVIELEKQPLEEPQIIEEEQDELDEEEQEVE